LEITESMLMSADSAIRMLSQLHALGVGISIDDFGTGLFVSQLSCTGCQSVI
jgi:EAL domain-containing protein (putative c-di-GMP-specific phosphodiesterase class I)